MYPHFADKVSAVSRGRCLSGISLLQGHGKRGGALGGSSRFYRRLQNGLWVLACLFRIRLDFWWRLVPHLDLGSWQTRILCAILSFGRISGGILWSLLNLGRLWCHCSLSRTCCCHRPSGGFHKVVAQLCHMEGFRWKLYWIEVQFSVCCLWDKLWFLRFPLRKVFGFLTYSKPLMEKISLEQGGHILPLA